MRILTGTLLGALLATTALPAFAADLILEETTITMLPVLGSSTGFYVGAHVGPTIVGVDYDPDFDPPEVYQFSKPSLTAGVAFGWDTMLGSNLVGGLELRYDLFSAAFTPFDEDDDLFRFHDTVSLTGKLGYLVAPGTQVYGVLGFGSAGVEAPEGLGDDFVSGRVTGVVAGVGAETRLTDQLSANVDVRYFRSFDTFTTTDGVSFLPRYLAVTAGLKFRFDDGLGYMTAEPEQIDFDFTGPNVSVSALAVAASMERNNIVTPGADVGPFWSEGIGIGVGLGYDFDIGNGWVIGATANLDYHPLDFHDPGADTPLVDGTTKFATVDTVISASVRLGVKTNPSTLVYAKAGVAGINTHANEDFFALDGGGTELLPAVQLGLGVETAIADQVTLGVEGNYTAATSPLVTENTQLNQIELWPTLLTGKLTLKYHF